MSEKPYHKTKVKLVDALTSNEDEIRFRIWSGEIPLWEAAKARFNIMWKQAEAEVYWTTKAKVRQEIQDSLKEEELHMADIYSIDGKKLSGGKTPPEKGADWLTPLKVGTTFVCELNQDIGLQAAIQQEYILQRRDGKSVMLISNLNEPEVHARVNAERFCRYYDLVEVLFEPEQEQENGSY